MSGFSHLARTVALAAALVVSGAAMAKGAAGEKPLQATNSNAAAAPGGAVPQALSLVNVAGINSFEEIGSAANTVLLLNVGANGTVVGIGWDVIISAFSPSYLSEMIVSFENSDQSDGVFLTVGFGDGFAGLNAAYTSNGILDLVGAGFSFNVLSDGILRIEFFEDFDDSAVSPDGRWVSGNLTVDVTAAVPEPSTYGLMALGLLGVAGVARRRSSV